VCIPAQQKHRNQFPASRIAHEMPYPHGKPGERIHWHWSDSHGLLPVRNRLHEDHLTLDSGFPKRLLKSCEQRPPLGCARLVDSIVSIHTQRGRRQRQNRSTKTNAHVLPASSQRRPQGVRRHGARCVSMRFKQS
jgi:hypothetical protein